MFRVLLAAISASLVTGADAQDLKLPKFAAEDSWVYHQTIQKGDKTDANDTEVSVVRSDDQDLLVSVKAVGSTRSPVEVMFKPDWAKFRSVNGVETVVGRPLAFPLALGKSWNVNYEENNPNPAHVREEFDTTYKVVGWEDVTTPAGAFKALKIEGKGNWVADSPARVQTNSVLAKQGVAVAQSTQNVVQGPRRATGRIYHVVWYVPEVKRWVKSRDETLSASGQVSESEETELTAFHLAPASP
ncbi:MAG: hypothetical protein JOY52_02835 [Hyphomicrobiales bacterium]|nr:hypothetical protein [Hyphomicrobiales bacterium]